MLVDHTQSPPFCVMETSAELLYLLKFADKKGRPLSFILISILDPLRMLESGAACPDVYPRWEMLTSVSLIDIFGFTDELERNEALQWLFFWHGSGAPYQGQVNHFNKFAKEKIPCKHSRDSIGFQQLITTKTRSSASRMRRCESMGCLRSVFQENILANLETTLLVQAKVSIRSLILGLGLG